LADPSTATWCREIGKPLASKVGSSADPAVEPMTITCAMAAIKNIFFMAISSWIEMFAPRFSK
jgi:hypothetical protein